MKFIKFNITAAATPNKSTGISINGLVLHNCPMNGYNLTAQSSIDIDFKYPAKFSNKRATDVIASLNRILDSKDGDLKRMTNKIIHRAVTSHI